MTWSGDPAAGGDPTGPPSLWSAQLGPPGPARPALAGDREADVVIVGAGFTGLWTAYHLLQLEPGRRVVIVERERAGFGASGRNGGWCSALFPRDGWAQRMRPALVEAVDGVGAVAAAEGIDCDYARAGRLTVATTPAQLARLRPGPGTSETTVGPTPGIPATTPATPVAGPRWLDATALAAMIRIPAALGGLFDPDCAALHPGRLARGLAAAVERRGATIHEGSPARAVVPGLVTTPAGQVRAPVVVRATEAYTASLPGARRELAPVYSLMIATAPLPAAAWDEIGWRDRFTLSDGRHLIIYAQRTADGRIALGGRGAPYHWGSRVSPAFDASPRVFEHLARVLAALFPAAAGVPVTHRWGGPLGVPRDWTPAVTFDASTGLAAAGGYVGDGVAASYLAGQTLAELVTGRRTHRTALPWVNHARRRWEVEPLRWAGINAGRLLAAAADRRENRVGRPSRLAGALDRLTGHS